MRSERAGAAAGVVNDVARRPNDRARRIGRVIRPQREPEERDERQQRERTLNQSSSCGLQTSWTFCRPAARRAERRPAYSLVRVICQGTSMPDELSVNGSMRLRPAERRAFERIRPHIISFRPKTASMATLGRCGVTLYAVAIQSISVATLTTSSIDGRNESENTGREPSATKHR